jgi:tRNA/tmRNA/rRNA uracil-C5-methylase (TrmA/RlmC/RlmD family)
VSPRTRLSDEPRTARVDGFTHGGEGVARVEGKAVFIAGALPGEEVVLRVVDDRKRWARAELVEVVESSPDRVEPPCPHAPRPGREGCGGCDLQHAAPEAQRRLKAQVVREQLERLGRIEDPPVVACRSVGPDLGYRTHARMHAAPDGRLGFHVAGTHDVVPIEVCPKLTAPVQALREEVGDDTGAAEVTLRAHAETGTSTVVLHPGPGPLELPETTADLLLAQPDGAVAAMRGDGSLAEIVDGRRYGFGATSFFQVSPEGAQAIVDEVREAVADVGGALVWDLYAGVGLLSLALAADGAEVVAVEGHADAAAHAEANAAACGLDLDVRAMAVGTMVRRAARRQPREEDGPVDDPPDVVVLDPPRTGAGEDVVAQLARLAPGRIVYVACDPAALARDAATLAGAGYRLQRAVPLDLFPMTHHVEVVATFVP